MAEGVSLELDDDLNITTKLNQRFNDSRTARLTQERQWVENFAFVIGIQHSLVNINQDRTIQVLNPPAPSWRVRLPINKILPIVRILTSKITKIVPKFIVIPNRPDEADISSAKIGTKILGYFAQKMKFTLLRTQVVLLSVIFGTAFLKTFFNPKSGRANNVEVDEEVDTGKLDGDGKPIKEKKKVTKKVMLGEQETIVVTPFEIFPQPSATDMDNLRWFFHASFQSVDEVFENYGVKVPAEKGVQITPLHNHLMSLMGKNTTFRQNDGVLVKEYWERPNAMNPDGMLITFVADKVLQKGKLPKGTVNPDTGEVMFPIEPFYYFKMLDNFWGESTIPHAIPLQKEYNRARSQIIEYKNLMVKGKYLIPIGCNISRNAFTTEPGEKIYYNSAGGTPTIMQFQPLPEFVFTNITALSREMDDIFGIHEVSQAKPPGAIRSGIAIQFLQEQDDTQLGLTLNWYEEALKNISRKMLVSIRENYPERRLIRLIGQGHAVDLFYFKGEDLPEDPYVDVELGAGLPLSKVARQQFVLQLWKEKLITDPEKVLKKLDTGIVNDMFEDDFLDESDAREENRIMFAGVVDPPREWENHAIHIKVHNTFRKSTEFKKVTRKAAEIFQEHLKLHEEFIQKEIKQQLELQAQVQGASGGNGGGGNGSLPPPVPAGA